MLIQIRYKEELYDEGDGTWGRLFREFWNATSLEVLGLGGTCSSKRCPVAVGLERDDL